MGYRCSIPILTKEQNRVLNEIIYGAEIQVSHDSNGKKTTYHLVTEGGDDTTIRKETFLKLQKSGLIKLKSRPHLDHECWA